MLHLSKSAPVIALLMIWMTILTGCGGSSDTTTVTETETTTVTTAAPESPVASTTTLKEDVSFAVCHDGISLIGNGVTSCEFAFAVREAYLRTRSSSLFVESPKMHAFYPMRCTTGFTAKFKGGNSLDAVKCEEWNGWDGKDDAIVYVALN